MDITKAILSRRTIKDFKQEPVPEDILNRALTAGTWAQNHRLTQPWRFAIFGPETREALASAFSDSTKKILSKPCIVAVSYRLNGDKMQRREDYAAVCCAIQNIQLAAWAEGVGMQWTTSKMIQQPQTYDLLEIDPEKEKIIGFLYFGYPSEVPSAKPRKTLEEVTRRLL